MVYLGLRHAFFRFFLLVNVSLLSLSFEMKSHVVHNAVCFAGSSVILNFQNFLVAML